MGPDDTVAGLIARLTGEGLRPGTWSNGPRDAYAAHEHAFDKVLVCAAGSIEFGLPGRGEQVLLHVGDRLDLPAGTEHNAIVGPDGVMCLEAHLPAGTLSSAPVRRPAGVW
jgi:quercetin dioxygenase-like cupin family protein